MHQTLRLKRRQNCVKRPRQCKETTMQFCGKMTKKKGKCKLCYNANIMGKTNNKTIHLQQDFEIWGSDKPRARRQQNK